ncbi:unnamed protein product [Closterium sp. Naga37s-1]|nr:unnamed protein product [Closterium sp. Naga37s-1]
MAEGNYPRTGEWTTDWCGCFDDISSCCCVLFCPCVAVGRIAEIADSGDTDACEACCCWYLIQACTFGSLGCLYSKGKRLKLRRKYGLPAKPCGDCLMHWCCAICSISQEYRELQNRGWKPSLGYSQNKNNSPPPQQFMT